MDSSRGWIFGNNIAAMCAVQGSISCWRHFNSVRNFSNITLIFHKFKNFHRCETYTANDAPTNYNKRSECREILYREKIFSSEPQFGIEFSIETKNEFPHQSFVDAFYRVCLRAGVKIHSTNSTKNKCNFQIGPCDGITVGDDLWISRFLLQRLADKLEINVTFEYVQKKLFYYEIFNFTSNFAK